MKTYEELDKRGTSYLCGYTDALADFANEIALNHPELHNCSTLQLLAFLNDYMGGLLKKVGGVENAAE